MAKLALRFISGKYKGKEHVLEEGKTIVLGRSSDADIVLLEDMVSRRHTVMILEGEELEVSDNGSTNGTFVNGEKILKASAHKGDRILIGTSIMKVVDAGNTTEAVAAVNPTISVDVGKKTSHSSSYGSRHGNSSRATMHNNHSHSGVSSMSGTIAEVPLPDLLQLFSTSKKTGTLVLNYNFTIAKIHLESGQIIFASLSDQPGLDPLKAMFRILAWEEGEFDLIGQEAHNFPSTIDLPTAHILMEGLRQLDELQRDKDKLPAPESPIIIPTPLVPKLSKLEDNELDVFQIVLNASDITVQDIINASDQSDNKASTILAGLLKKKYLLVDSVN